MSWDWPLLRRLKETLFQREEKVFVCGRDEIFKIMPETPKGMFKDFIEIEFLERKPDSGWALVCRDSLGRGFLLDSNVNQPARTIAHIFVRPERYRYTSLYYWIVEELIMKGLEHSPETLPTKMILLPLVDVFRVELKARREGIDSLTEEEKETYYNAPALQMRVATFIAMVPKVAYNLFSMGAYYYPPPWTVELWDWIPPQCLKKVLETRPITRKEVEEFFWERR